RLATRSVSRYLDILSYENVNDVDLRATIREGIGLCNRHAWQFIDGTRTPLGTAIIYRDLIRTLQHRTTAAVRSSDGTRDQLLVEALSSAPRLNGTQIGAAENDLSRESSPLITVASTAEGHCPVCASVATWLGTAGPFVAEGEAGLLCAVHAWNAPQPSGQNV